MDLTPKILYQTWKTKHLPEKFEKNRQKWIDMYPDWKHVLLTDDDLRDLVKNNFPQYLDFYDSFNHFIEKVDFARYVMMYLGGVYADLDTYPLKRIDPFLDTGKIVLGREPLEHCEQLYERREVVLCNAFMISPHKRDFWIRFMDYIVKNYRRDKRPVYTTGPMAMTYFYEEHPDAFCEVIITDPCVFFPMINNGNISKFCNVERDSYVVHEWENSWIWKFPKITPRNCLTGFVIILIIILLFQIYYR